MGRCVPAVLALLVTTALVTASAQARRPSCPRACGAERRACGAAAKGRAREGRTSCRQEHANDRAECDNGACRGRARCPGPARFAAGTTASGELNCALNPSDVNTWGLLALGEPTSYGAAIDWVEAACARTEPCFAGGAPATGIAFGAEGDGIWWEGTAHTALAQAMRGESTRAQALLGAVVRALDEAPEAGAGGLVAACRDGVATGIDGFALHARRHVGATAWFVLAATGRNPFWGIGVGEAIPHAGE